MQYFHLLTAPQDWFADYNPSTARAWFAMYILGSVIFAGNHLSPWCRLLRAPSNDWQAVCKDAEKDQQQEELPADEEHT